MPRGGKRRGAGRPKGSKEKGTLQKEAAREVLREMVKAELGPMTQAQIAKAIGTKYLVYRDKKLGKFITVKAEDLQAAQQENIVEVWEREPCTQAFTDLMNRTLDKPAEQVQTDHTGTITIKWAGE